MIYAVDPKHIAELNERYATQFNADCKLNDHLFNRFTSVPSFGQAIRPFPNDVANTSQRPAWHFEDVLQVRLATATLSCFTRTTQTIQCAIPVFQGLLPPNHDAQVQVLLFRLAEWHALAKLQLHTDRTLVLLDQALRRLGDQLRRFQKDTCAAIPARELPQETNQRQRREVADIQSGRRKGAVTSTALPKTINLNTYKFHALGDYSRMIKMYGSTDSYSTLVVSSNLIAAIDGHKHLD